ncbi:hypothetical protein Fot_03645 [Forsythia ovata]|uniref:Uncharacterized protein n=1 Tax=Forsythia ovata TaxID=205694 RepID=A0ABD1XAX0_9LAMI
MVPGPLCCRCQRWRWITPILSPAPEATSDVPSTSVPTRSVPSPGSARQSEKRKAGAKSGVSHPRHQHLPLSVSANTSTLVPPGQAGSNSLRKIASSGCHCGVISS